MKRPVAVVISDIHYNINTIELADAALRQAIAKAYKLQVPLIVAGDLHDTKANMRAECLTAMINTFQRVATPTYVLRGNHDQINEKSESHSLEFLKLIDSVYVLDYFAQSADFNFIPYQSSVEMFTFYLSKIPKGSTIIMHQGVQGSSAGDYLQDPTAIDKSLLADYRVISGHYHTRQDIKCGRPRAGAVGLMSYIGNPYTLNFGEANDPEKGYRVLNSDGTLDFIPTGLRKHRVIEIEIQQGDCVATVGDLVFNNKEDIVKVKVTGTKEDLSNVNKAVISQTLNYNGDFRLELIPLENTAVLPQDTIVSLYHTLDVIIDSLQNTSNEQKERLKTLWKGICA